MLATRNAIGRTDALWICGVSFGGRYSQESLMCLKSFFVTSRLKVGSVHFHSEILSQNRRSASLSMSADIVL